MKQKPTFKSLLVVASIFSFFAFVFVNLHSNIGVKQNSEVKMELVPTQMQDDEDNDEKVALPEVAVLGRLWDIAHKLIDRKH